MATVSIACNLPHGLFAQLYKMVEKPTGPQGVMTPTAEPDGERVHLRGGNHPRAIAGWGLTDNIDASWAEAWMKQNESLAPVKAGLIVVRDNAAKAAATAQDKEGMKNGFEALDPKAMPAGLSKAEA